MQEERIFTYKQESPYKSPRSLSTIFLQIVWQYVWWIFCLWTPKPFNAWRLFCLRLFGAKLYGKPFVHPLARIHVPWLLTMHDRSTLGERATVYSLGEIELRSRSTVAQEAYLCAATHQFDDANLSLMLGKITIGEDAFVCARAFIMPGIIVGDGAVIGACSVVTRDVPAWTIAAGNPCKPIKERVMNSQIKQ